MEGQEPAQDKEKSQLCFPDRARPGGRNLPRQGWWGPEPGARSSSCLAAPPFTHPQPSGTFQRLFMRYFLSKTWDLRRRLQRLAFSARLLSQGWARHWAALMRALWGGGSVERLGGVPTDPGAQPAFQPVPTRPAHAYTGLAQWGSCPVGSLTPGP